MISFKSFINTIHDAILSASTSLMDKNLALLDNYFYETQEPATDSENPTDTKILLRPKTVVMEYPHPNAEGGVDNLEVSVPLITLAPINLSQIEKVTLTADFDMELQGEDVWLSMPSEHGIGLFKKPRPNTTKLEITLTPQDTPEGLKMLVEGYEAMLKRQLG